MASTIPPEPRGMPSSPHAYHQVSEKALQFNSRMHSKNHPMLEKATILCIIKACGKTKAVCHGHHVHNYVVEHGLEDDLFIANSFIDMYGKCGSLDDAYAKFARMPCHSVVSWGAIINAYAQHGQGVPALQLLKQMILESPEEPNKVIYLGSLKACSCIKDVHSGHLLYNKIIRKGLDSDVSVANSIVDMYSKCGKVGDARKVFDGISCPTVVSRGAMLAGYVNNDLGALALGFFRDIQEQGVEPNMAIFVCALKACGGISALDQGRFIHKQVKRLLSQLDTIVGNALMDMYVRCGSMKEAYEVFDDMPAHDAASYDIMIAGCSHNEGAHTVLELLHRTDRDGIKPEKSTFLHALKACNKAAQGRIAHFFIAKHGLDSEVAVGTSLIHMYQRHGYIREASDVFEKLSTKDEIAWGAMMEAYAECGEGLTALKLLEKTEERGSSPSTAMLLSALKACASMQLLKQGRAVHSGIVKGGCENDASVGSSLVHMYVNCGSLVEAQRTFDGLGINEDMVLWSSLISGCAQTAEHGDRALELFEEMLRRGIESDQGMYSSVMKACANMRAVIDGRLIHSSMVCSGIETGTSSTGVALVDLYTKCGAMEDAARVFGALPKSNVLPWGLMLAGYVRGGDLSSALELFEQMEEKGAELDEAMVLALLKVFGAAATIEHGSLIHELVVRCGRDCETVFGNALVDMYAKCGGIDEASKVFGGVLSKDAITWGAMIAGFARHGRFARARECVERMQSEGGGVRPTEIVFVHVLAACSHGGVLDGGHDCFASMAEEHGIAPQIEHYSGMADLLSRAGHLESAKDMLHSMPFAPDLLGFTSLLSSCKTYGHSGSIAAHCLARFLELDAGPDPV